MVGVEGFDIAELEKKITKAEQRFLEITTGVTDPNADVDDMDLLSQLRHRTNAIVERIVTRPNLRSVQCRTPSASISCGFVVQLVVTALPYLTLPYLRGGQVVTPAQR